MKTGLSKFLKAFLPLSIMLTVIGWGGLLIVIRGTVPTLGPRWFFFFLGVLALTGPVLPIVYFLNQRFPSTPPVEDDWSFCGSRVGRRLRQHGGLAAVGPGPDYRHGAGSGRGLHPYRVLLRLF